MQVYVSFVAGQLITAHRTDCHDKVRSVHFSIAPSLPSGLFLDSLTGLFYGIPKTCAAPRIYTLLCRGADGTTVSKGMLLEILPPMDFNDEDKSAESAICLQNDTVEHTQICTLLASGKSIGSTDHVDCSPRLITQTLDRCPSWTSIVMTRSRSPSPLRSAADAAVLLPLGPRLMLALCDGDEARRVMRARRMGRAAFIAAGAAMEGSVRRDLSSPRPCQLSFSPQCYQLTVPPHQRPPARIRVCPQSPSRPDTSRPGHQRPPRPPRGALPWSFVPLTCFGPRRAAGRRGWGGGGGVPVQAGADVLVQPAGHGREVCCGERERERERER